MSEPRHDDAEHRADGSATPLVVATAAEPRARELVDAAAGASIGYDPGERWERAAAGSPTPPMVRRPPFETRVEPVAVLGGWLQLEASRPEYNISPDVAAALRESSPQWFLRDLDRPKDMPPVLLELREGTQALGQWEQAVAEATAARVLSARPTVVSAAELIDDEIARRAAFFAEPWQPALPDEAPRRQVLIYADGG